jgi:phage tail sheath gpL-like
LLQEQLEEVVSERDIWKAAAILASDKLTTTIAERDALREVADALNVALDVDPDLEDARDRLTTALAKVPQ